MAVQYIIQMLGSQWKKVHFVFEAKLAYKYTVLEIEKAFN